MMRIHIKKNGETLWQAGLADDFLSRARGLMLKGRLPKDDGLLIRFSPHLRSRSIHGFFMRFPLDLVFIGEDKKVADIARLKEWSVYSPKAPCSWVLEVNAGDAERKGVSVGDQLEF